MVLHETKQTKVLFMKNRFGSIETMEELIRYQAPGGSVKEAWVDVADQVSLRVITFTPKTQLNKSPY